MTTIIPCMEHCMVASEASWFVNRQLEECIHVSEDPSFRTAV
jgi:hypothetical protein